MGKFYKRALVAIGLLYLIHFVYSCNYSAKNTEYNNTKEFLIGNWHYCSEDLGYTEIYFISSAEVIFYDLNTGLEIQNYLIRDDSIVLFSEYHRFPFEITILDKDNIMLKSDGDYNLSLSRLKDEIKVMEQMDQSSDSFDKFHEGFWFRAQGKCVPDK
jgi:hypothetical protein